MKYEDYGYTDVPAPSWADEVEFLVEAEAYALAKMNLDVYVDGYGGQYNWRWLDAIDECLNLKDDDIYKGTTSANRPLLIFFLIK